MKSASRIVLSFMLWLPSSMLHAATVTVSANGNSTGPVVVNAGTPVNFDAVVACANTSDLIVVPGTTRPKKPNKSEVSWTIQNQTANPITITGFGVSWQCVNDPNNVCANWRFDYIKLDKQPTNPTITQANKEFRGLAPVATDFPIHDFTADPNNFVANGQEFFVVNPGQSISINEIEFVDANGKKYKNLQGSGLSVDFTARWRDNNGNVYVQNFNITW